MDRYKTGEAPVFVKIEDYKDILGILDLVKDKLSEAKRTLADINEVKNDENSELELWGSTLNEIEKKLENINSTLFGPESTG
jgi:septation ring formation regulator EzrA|tara:strand:- start:2306 stop:2551 length:246 start_codon:yes stop_codon:yes gene_type:complete